MIQRNMQQRMQPVLGTKPSQPMSKPGMQPVIRSGAPGSKPAAPLVQPLSRLGQSSRPLVPGQSTKTKPANQRADLSFGQFDDDDDIELLPEKTTITQTPRQHSGSSPGMIKKPLISGSAQNASSSRPPMVERDTMSRFQAPAPPKQLPQAIEKKELEFSFKDENDYDSMFPEALVESELDQKMEMDQSMSKPSMRSNGSPMRSRGSPMQMDENEYKPVSEDSHKRVRQEQYDEFDGGIRMKRVHVSEETETLQMLTSEPDLSSYHQDPEPELDQQQQNFDMGMDEQPRDADMDGIQAPTFEQLDEPNMDLGDNRPQLPHVDLDHIEQIASSLFAAPLKTTTDFLGVFDTVFAVLRAVEKERLDRLAEDLEITRNEMESARSSVEAAFGELTKMMQEADDTTNAIQEATQEKHARMAGMVDGLAPIRDLAITR